MFNVPLMKSFWTSTIKKAEIGRTIWNALSPRDPFLSACFDTHDFDPVIPTKHKLLSVHEPVTVDVEHVEYLPQFIFV